MVSGFNFCVYIWIMKVKHQLPIDFATTFFFIMKVETYCHGFCAKLTKNLKW